MNNLLQKYIVAIIIGILVCINLLQGTFTELFHDEAYYWTWSQQMAWGYYDHPPAIAFFIRLGTTLLSGEIGVRLFVVILNALTLYLIYLLTDKKQPLLLFAMLLAAPFVHIGGILAVPDSPFVFFVALYLFCYKKFVEENTWLSVLWLSFAITGMMYSKYHGLMVLFFTILSYPKLLIDKKFWAIVAISTILYLPRLYWASQHNGFDTFIYHFLVRSKLEFSTFDYVGGEIGATGGIIGLWLFYEAFSFKSTNLFEKSLAWICWGIFGFLLLLTFFQHVEANWAAAAVSPLFLLAYRGLSQKQHLFKRFYTIAIPTIAILCVARIFLIWDILPIKTEFHGWKKWAKQIAEIAQGCPVVFNDTYQFPSKYMFYAPKQQAISMNSPHYRHNQYDIGDFEEKMQGKRVLLMLNNTGCYQMQNLKTPMGTTLNYMFVDNFRSFNKVKIAFLNEQRTFKANEVVSFPISLTNGYAYPCDFNASKNLEARLTCKFWQNGVYVWNHFLEFPDALQKVVLTDSLHKNILIKMPEKAGDYNMTMMLQYGCALSGYQAPMISIKVE